MKTRPTYQASSQGDEKRHPSSIYNNNNNNNNNNTTSLVRRKWINMLKVKSSSKIKASKQGGSHCSSKDKTPKQGGNHCFPNNINKKKKREVMKEEQQTH